MLKQANKQDFGLVACQNRNRKHIEEHSAIEKMSENILNSRPITTAASKARIPYPTKQYAADGRNIPLQKNWLESWCTLAENFDKVLPQLLDMEVRDDDVFVVTYMKSGTTWMQEAVWLLTNNVNFDEGKEKSLWAESPFIDFQGILPTIDSPIEICNQLPSPRLIKTHMPAHLLPRQVWEKKPKIIYVARNVKDVIVSSFHFVKNVGMWLGDNFDDYVEDFINNEIHYTSFWTHVLDFWQMRHEPNIFFVTYEGMKRDLSTVLQRLCSFLKKSELTAEELKKALEHLSFSSMSSNTHTNLTEVIKKAVPNVKEDFQFMRRGVMGSFRDELTPALQEKIDQWTERCLAPHGLKEEDIFGEF